VSYTKLDFPSQTKTDTNADFMSTFTLEEILNIHCQCHVCLCYAGGKWRTMLLGTFFKSYIQKPQQVWAQIRSWMICFRRKSLVQMTMTDFSVFS